MPDNNDMASALRTASAEVSDMGYPAMAVMMCERADMIESRGITPSGCTSTAAESVGMIFTLLWSALCFILGVIAAQF